MGLSKRWSVIAFVAVFICGCVPVWYSLTRIQKAPLDVLYTSLPPLASAWKSCSSGGSDERSLLASPWSITLMAVDSGSNRHADVLQGVSEHLDPLFEQLNRLFPGLEVALQTRYHTPLGDSNATISPQLLSSLFQVQDWARDATSQRTNIVLVLYFYDEPPIIPAEYRAFTIGQTSAVVTVVRHRSDDSDGQRLKTVTRGVSTVFARQIRELFGLPSADLVVDAPPTLSDSEVARLTELYSSAYITQAIHHLVSLRDIVDRLPNLEILDRVADTISRSVLHLDRAIAAACTSVPQKPTAACLRESLQSASLANEAYFDPSLTATLYYSNDHTLAIYGSTFLTAIATVLLAAMREWKYGRSRRASLTTPETTPPPSTTATTAI